MPNVKSEYLMKRDYYLKRHQEYIAARQTYLNYQTLQTKENLTKKLKQFLIARNEFLKSYFLVLLSGKESFLPMADSIAAIRFWINWLDQETKQIDSAESLEQLFIFADRLKNKYPEIERAIFIFLTKFTISQQNHIIEKIKQLIIEIKNELKALNQDSRHTFDWLDEIVDQLPSIEEKQRLALEIIEKTRVSKISKIGRMKVSWRKSKKLLLEANFQLEETIGFLDEIIVSLGQ